MLTENRQILEHIGVYQGRYPKEEALRGKIITIVNRSEVVGRPLAAMLSNDGAKVYSVDVNDVLEFIPPEIPGEGASKVTQFPQTVFLCSIIYSFLRSLRFRKRSFQNFYRNLT